MAIRSILVVQQMDHTFFRGLHKSFFFQPVATPPPPVSSPAVLTQVISTVPSPAIPPPLPPLKLPSTVKAASIKPAPPVKTLPAASPAKRPDGGVIDLTDEDEKKTVNSVKPLTLSPQKMALVTSTAATVNKSAPRIMYVYNQLHQDNVLSSDPTKQPVTKLMLQLNPNVLGKYFCFVDLHTKCLLLKLFKKIFFSKLG